VKRANELLGRPYSLTGKVIKGKGLATQLGFPTLNLKIPEKEKLVPADGVYQVCAYFQEKKYYGVMNIGFAPTVPNKLQVYPIHSLEVHLFGFEGTKQSSLGKELKVVFYNYIRPEKRFNSLDELKKQIAEDIQRVRGLVK
jgi:riboflavin kinase/FMN adenylyltransferase